MLLCAALCGCNPDKETSTADEGGSATGSTGSTGAGDGTSPTTGQPPAGEANYIFTTSTLHTGALDGLEGADAVCNQRAAAAGLPGQFVAWLSTEEVNAIDRVAGARGWIRPDGRPFADEVEDLLGENWYPPMLDEFGQQVPDERIPLTGTNYEGVFFAAFSSCAGWTSETGNVGGGRPTAGISEWTSAYGIKCDAPGPIFCLGIDQNTPLTLPPAEGRRAFLSKPFVSGEGVAGADAQCQAEADQFGLSGSYQALLATEANSATSRFDLTGPTWFRLDGVQLFEQAADLATGRPLAPLYIRADGTWAAQLVWLGAPTPGAPAAGTCDDWTATEGSTLIGRSTDAGDIAYGGMDQDCAEKGALYCFEI